MILGVNGASRRAKGWVGEIGRAVEDNPAVLFKKVRVEQEEGCCGRI